MYGHRDSMHVEKDLLAKSKLHTNMEILHDTNEPECYLRLYSVQIKTYQTNLCIVKAIIIEGYTHATA